MSVLRTHLHIEGTTQLQVLTYGLMKPEAALAGKRELDEWASHQDHFLFEHPQWPMTIVLKESSFQESEFAPADIAASLDDLMRSLAPVDACFCMLDGVFSDPRSLFEEEYESIYAILNRDDDLNIAMSDDLRRTAAWKAEVAKLQALFGQHAVQR